MLRGSLSSKRGTLQSRAQAPPPLKSVPSAKAEGFLCVSQRRAPHGARPAYTRDRGPHKHCDAGTGRPVSACLILDCPSPGHVFPSWACEPVCKLRATEGWGQRSAKTSLLYKREPLVTPTTAVLRPRSQDLGNTLHALSPSPKNCLPTKTSSLQGAEPESRIPREVVSRRRSDRRMRTTACSCREGGLHRGRRGRASDTKLARFERATGTSSCQRPEVLCAGHLWRLRLCYWSWVSVFAPGVLLFLASRGPR